MECFIMFFSKTKKLIKMLLPPWIIFLFQKLRQKTWEYSGDYSSWQDAAKNTLGYNTAEIFEKVFYATQQVLDGKAVFERDSVLFYQEEYNIPLLKALFQIARKKGRLHVLDFGGALGSVFFQNSGLLKSAVEDIEWIIVEQPAFFEASKKLVFEKELRFCKTVEEAKISTEIDVVLFSSVLQYLENIAEITDQVQDIDYIIIDRHPEFTVKKSPQITVQNIREPIYNASYPVKIYGCGELEKYFIAKYTLLDKWYSGCSSRQFLKSNDGTQHESQYVGMLFKRNI